MVPGSEGESQADAVVVVDEAVARAKGPSLTANGSVLYDDSGSDSGGGGGGGGVMAAGVAERQAAGEAEATEDGAGKTAVLTSPVAAQGPVIAPDSAPASAKWDPTQLYHPEQTQWQIGATQGTQWQLMPNHGGHEGEEEGETEGHRSTATTGTDAAKANADGIEITEAGAGAEREGGAEGALSVHSAASAKAAERRDRFVPLARGSDELHVASLDDAYAYPFDPADGATLGGATLGAALAFTQSPEDRAEAPAGTGAAADDQARSGVEEAAAAPLFEHVPLRTASTASAASARDKAKAGAVASSQQDRNPNNTTDFLSLSRGTDATTANHASTTNYTTDRSPVPPAEAAVDTGSTSAGSSNKGPSHAGIAASPIRPFVEDDERAAAAARAAAPAEDEAEEEVYPLAAMDEGQEEADEADEIIETQASPADRRLGSAVAARPVASAHATLTPLPVVATGGTAASESTLSPIRPVAASASYDSANHRRSNIDAHIDAGDDAIDLATQVAYGESPATTPAASLARSSSHPTPVHAAAVPDAPNLAAAAAVAKAAPSTVAAPPMAAAAAPVAVDTSPASAPAPAQTSRSGRVLKRKRLYEGDGADRSDAPPEKAPVAQEAAAAKGARAHRSAPQQPVGRDRTQESKRRRVAEVADDDEEATEAAVGDAEGAAAAAESTRRTRVRGSTALPTAAAAASPPPPTRRQRTATAAESPTDTKPISSGGRGAKVGMPAKGVADDRDSVTAAGEVRCVGTKLDDLDAFTQMVESLGGRCVEKTAEATHLVVQDSAVSSAKFLEALLVTPHIVTLEWLRASKAKGRFLLGSEDSYIPAIDEEHQRVCPDTATFARTLRMRKAVPVYPLHGLSLFLVDNSKAELFGELLTRAGAQVLNALPSDPGEDIRRGVPAVIAVAPAKAGRLMGISFKAASQLRLALSLRIKCYNQDIIAGLLFQQQLSQRVLDRFAIAAGDLPAAPLASAASSPAPGARRAATKAAPAATVQTKDAAPQARKRR
jgi:hypothetical protein